MKHIIIICIIFFILYIINNNSFKGGNKPQGAANMPEGPERDAAMKKEKEMKGKYASKQNIKIKKNSKQNALQKILDKLIYENGKTFLTFS